MHRLPPGTPGLPGARRKATAWRTRPGRTAPAATTAGGRRPRCGRRPPDVRPTLRPAARRAQRPRPAPSRDAPRSTRAGARPPERRRLAVRPAARALGAEAPTGRARATRHRSGAACVGGAAACWSASWCWASWSTALRGEQLSTGFDLGIIVGSVVAILAVRRSGMFWVVVSPPIVYSLGAGISLYLRSGGLHDRGVLIDAATNWLVYGFPAIAARHRRRADHRRHPADPAASHGLSRSALAVRAPEQVSADQHLGAHLGAAHPTGQPGPPVDVHRFLAGQPPRGRAAGPRRAP